MSWYRRGFLKPRERRLGHVAHLVNFVERVSVFVYVLSRFLDDNRDNIRIAHLWVELGGEDWGKEYTRVCRMLPRQVGSTTLVSL